ncbi:MAG TPA: response regulator [Anaeromyxobacter sp.]
MVPRKRILIIEEDADVREALGDALRDAGLAVDVADDGKDGLERLRAGTVPSLILLDLRMPGLGGAEFLRALRDDEAFEHVPVISMTAGCDPAGSEDVVAHLHKPFDLDDLLEIVLSVVGASAA